MMTAINGAPKTVLLATDLSPRCDRALDRAVSLAEAWGARLVILNALEDPEQWVSDFAAVLPSWKQPPDQLTVARKKLLDDIGSAAQAATIVIEEGEPGTVILQTAKAQGCDLIVTGLARDELLGRFSLGATVNHLLRRSHVPVLIVKNRAQRPYNRIVVATDFSESSRPALEAAAQFFPTHTLTIFHAYDLPMPGLTDSPSSRREYRKIAEQDYDSFLQSVKNGAKIKQHARLLVEHGPTSLLLREYVRDMNIDLVVLGTHGRSALLEVLIGSTAKQIVERLPCDALVVKALRPTEERKN